MKSILTTVIAALLSFVPLQWATAQQPIEKGAWTFKADQPDSVTFDYGTELSAEELDQLSKSTSLTRLTMGYAGVDSEYVTIEGDLTKLGKLKNLVEVHLCKDGIQDDDLKFIALLPKLEVLEFNADNGYDGAPICTDKCAQHLTAAKSLRSLIIHDGQFTDEFVTTLVKSLPHLETLSLGSADLTDASLQAISDHCKKLTSLSIVSEHFTADGLKHLDKMNQLKKRTVSSPELRKARNPKAISQLQGTWEYVSVQYEGKAVEFGPHERITMAGRYWTLKRDGKLISQSIVEVEPTRDPLWLTEYIPAGKVSFTNRWIYKLEDDRLVLCKSSIEDERRPNTFSSKPGDKQYLIVLKRIATK